MSQSGGANVPKFSSFKPRTTAKEQSSKTKHENSGRPQSDSHDRRRRDKETRSPVKDQRDKRKIHRSRHSRSRSPRRTPSESLEPTDWIIDVRGDPQNLQYSSIDRYKTPRYYCAGKGSVVGLPSHVKIDRDLSTQTEVVFRSTRRRGESQKVLSSKKGDIRKTGLQALSLTKNEAKPMDENFVEFEKEEESDDRRPAVVGVGMWKFIEGNDASRHGTCIE